MAEQFTRMSDLSLAGKRVLIREDLNVPIRGGKVANDARLKAALPTIQSALDAGALVTVCSHLGRPSEGYFEEAFSLAPIADYLREALGVPVELAAQIEEAKPAAGKVVLLENVRFNKGEKAGDPDLCRRYASLCDVFVMDAFGTAHRAQASTAGVIHHAPESCAGPLLASELEALGRALNAPEQPMLAIVGGSKVSTKLEVLSTLAGMCQTIIVGGGIANTFIAAAGYNVGKSLVEMDLVETARQIALSVNVPLPTDVVVIDASQIEGDFLTSIAKLPATVKPIDAIGDNDMILDIGPDSSRAFAEAIKEAKTILWNGPVGVFEVAAFAEGTRTIGQSIYNNTGFSIAGGGDTLAAIDQFKLACGISYISTGGGAFLEFVEGKQLPAVTALCAN